MKTLPLYVRDECANWSSNLKGCLGGSPCLVLLGKRCGYFERAVLPPEGYPYPNRTFAQNPKAEKQVRQEYGLVGGRRYDPKARFCKCGNPLAKYRQMCEQCRRKRRQKSKREYQRRWRRKNGGLT
mgnify:CR=1 FL=1